MATGQEIKRVFDAMTQIFVETGELIGVVNDTLEKEGFRSPNGSGVTWDQSRSYQYSRFWMPYFLQRVFTKKEDETRGIGINIMFRHSNYEIAFPVISCGYLLAGHEKKVVMHDEFFMAGWEKGTAPLYVTEGAEDDCYKMIQNYFIPLDRITGGQAVMDWIVAPLLDLYRDDEPAARKKVEGVAISREEILNDL